ncbi:crossover junction endodeoxyribonuclease RuvC [Geobacter sp.]|uniref:crossover junction endodeoxyribonuclease RuvC n=1 Tax=Geobacter sp. TaxID=46610 RepID=UPI00261CCB5C|nr:crossover junction endodeoxyribonuclease RuvC [Geobacter sp.]
MRVLGIDPGSRITGYGIIEKIGNRFTHVDNGAIFTDSHDEFALRLHEIYRGLTAVMEEYRPDAMAVEQVFLARNAQSALKLGQARGAAIVAGVNAGLPVAEYTAMQVKQAVVGYGHAGKDQVQQMVKALLGLPEIAQADASDALAVAICHANSALLRAVTGTLLQSSARRRR